MNDHSICNVQASSHVMCPKSHSITVSDPDVLYASLMIPLQPIAMLVGVILPLCSLETIKQALKPKDKRIPKFYFQFWAFHGAMLGYVLHSISTALLSSNTVDFAFAIVHIVYGLSLLSLIVCLGCSSENLNTPTHFFSGNRAHRAAMVTSMFLLCFSPYLLTNASPSFFVSLYHHRVQTLVWLCLCLHCYPLHQRLAGIAAVSVGKMLCRTTEQGKE